MRTLNVRLAVILLIIAVVFGAGVYVLHGFQQKRNANFFLEQAALAEQQAEIARKEKKTEEEEKAIKEQIKNMEWYLSLRRDDVDIMEKVGLLRADHIVDLPSFRQAYEYLEMVVREDPTRNEARRKLLELAMQAARYTDAREHLNYLLQESPDNPELLDLLGQCQEGIGEDENAVESYKKAIKYAPKQIDTYARLARVLRTRLEKTKEADACMQELVNNNPDSAKAQLLLGEYLAKNGSNEDALKAAEKALELSPEDKNALLMAAQCAVALDNLEKARKYAEHCLEVYKDSVTVYIALADVFVRLQGREKALEVLDQGLKETKNAPQILWFRANLLIDAGEIKAAEETMVKLRDTKYPKPLVDYLDARIAFGKKDWAEARRRLEKVRPALANWPALIKQVDLWLGYAFGRLNNLDQEIAAYQRALTADPFYAPARQYLTDALVKAGRVDDAVQEYYKLIRMGKVPSGGLIAFASLLIRQSLEQVPKERNWKQVEKVLDEAEKQNPDAFQIPLLRTEMLHAQNRDAEAEKLLLQARDKYPKQLEFWHALVSMAALQKQWDKAEKILQDYQSQMGDGVDLRLTRADYLIQRYGSQGGEALKKLEENSEGFSDADRLQLWNGLLTASRRMGDRELMEHYVDLLSQKDVNNLEIQYLRIEQAANDQDVATLEKVLKDVEKIEGKGPVWLLGQARLLTIQAKDGNPQLLEEAEKNLVQARELRPSWSRIPLLLAFIYDKQNKPVPTLENLMKAIDMGEHNPTVVRRAVQLLFQAQRYTDADKLLHQLDREQVPFTPEMTRLWVQLLIQRGEFDLAVAKARQTISEKSADFNEHLWLGQILAIAARRARTEANTEEAEKLEAEAEKSLRRAVELKDDVPASWVVLVQFLSSINKMDEAEKAVDEAAKKIPAEQAPVVLAQCYAAVQKNDLAMEQYKLALAAKPDDPVIVRGVANFYQQIGKSLEAEALLKRIIEGKVKGESDDLIWARRQLALITAAKGGLLNMEAARALIEKNLAAGGDSPDDLRIKAKFDAIDPRRSYKDEAINLLSKMMDGQQATAEDRYSLALLYLSIEKQPPSPAPAAYSASADDSESTAWLKASNILRKLVTSNNNEPVYLATYIKALLDHGDASSAELYLNRLASDFPNFAATVALQAEIMVRRNQYEEALDLLKGFVDRKNAVPEDRSKRIRSIAETIERLAERIKNAGQKVMADRYIRAAEMYYRQYIDDHPSQSLDLAVFFTRQEQIEDALNVLEQYWQNSDPITISMVCMDILQYDKNSQENAERVEKVLTEAQRKFPKHPAITLTCGDIRFMQGRYTEAENYYREILQDNPGHAVALNNLALLLALQGKNLDEAISMINQAIEIAGPLTSMLDTRASVYIAQGNAEKAINDMEEVVADAATPVRLFHQAQALQLGNQKYAAASTMQRALKGGLKKDMLQVLEIPAFEKLQKLAQDQDATSAAKE